MLINGTRYLTKCCMAEATEENGVYVCDKCEQPADLIEAVKKDTEGGVEGAEYTET